MYDINKPLFIQWLIYCCLYTFRNSKSYMMKKLISLLVIFSSFLQASAQNEIWSKKRISASLVENFVVSPAQKKMKNGEYFVVNDDKDELVRGKYKEGRKDSIWTFFNKSGEIIQQFDYRTNTMLFNTVDASSIVRETFLIDSTVDRSLKVTPPRKIGGVNYGFYLLYNEKGLPIQVKQQKNDVLMEYVFSLSETGNLEDWHIVYTSLFYNEDIKMSVRGLPSDAYEFQPALLGGKPVKSKLIYQIPLNINQARDKGTYNIPTHKN